MPVGKLLREMSWQEFAYWQAFDRRSPIGGMRGDLNTAHLAKCIAEHSGAYKEQQPLTDFLQRYDYFVPLTRKERKARRARKAAREAARNPQVATQREAALKAWEEVCRNAKKQAEAAKKQRQAEAKEQARKQREEESNRRRAERAAAKQAKP